MEPSELAADLRLRGGEGRERLGAAIEEGDEGLAVTLVAIELGEAVGGDLSRRILLERHHQDARGAVRIP